MRRRSPKVLALLTASVLVSGAAALAQHGAAPRPEMKNPTARDNQSQGKSFDERQFLMDTVTDGLTEVAIGKLGVEKASRDDVKQFAQKIVDDHTKANEELKELATGGGLTVPDALDEKQQARVDKLAKQSGGEFDKSFLKDQIKFHQQKIKEFQQETEGGHVQQLKDYVAKAQPTMEQHLDRAKELSKAKK